MLLYNFLSTFLYFLGACCTLTLSTRINLKYLPLKKVGTALENPLNSMPQLSPSPSLCHSSFLSLCASLSLSLNFVRNLCVFTGPEAASIIEFRTCTCHTYFCPLHCHSHSPLSSLHPLSKCIADITFILTVPFSWGSCTVCKLYKLIKRPTRVTCNQAQLSSELLT